MAQNVSGAFYHLWQRTKGHTYMTDYKQKHACAYQESEMKVCEGPGHPAWPQH